jgi:Ca-activated chloride channel family protein
MDDYNGLSRRSWGVAIVVLAAIVFGIITLAVSCEDGSCVGAPSNTSAGTASIGSSDSPTSTAEKSVVISFYTSDTKANWIRAVTETFNAGDHKTSSGQIIRVEVTQGDSGDLKEQIIAGQIQPTVFSPGEMSWINEVNQAWQQRYNKQLVTADCPPTAIAAIGFGMWKPMAEAMGWPDQPIGWGEILELANDPNGWGRYGHPEWGQFKFGHTHPLESNTGRLTIISLAYWALGQTDGLTPELVKSQKVTSAVRQLELRTNHYGASTRQLFTSMAELGPGYLHAGSTSETNLLITNQVQKDKLWAPLVFIPPADGTFWSNNPYCVLDGDWVTDEQREAAEIYKEYLLGEEQQRIAMQEHGLRPTNPAVRLGPLIDLASGTDPGDTPSTVPTLGTVLGNVAQAIDDVFIAEKKKAIIAVVLDTSTSMNGEKIKAASEATMDFLQVLQKDKQDEIYIFAFGTQVTELTPGGLVGEVLEEESYKVSGLFAEGNTALYDAICAAAERIYQRQDAYQAAGEQRLAGIVLLSDGVDTSSDKFTESDVFNFCIPKAEGIEPIPVYAIAYGADAQKDFLISIANYSYGRYYEAVQADLKEIYNGIAYQQ